MKSLRLHHLASSPIGRILTATTASQMLGMLTTFTSAALLGATDFGLLTAYLIWAGVIPQLFAFGIPDATLSRSGDDIDVLRNYQSSLILSASLGILGAVAMSFILHRFFDTSALIALIGASLVLFTTLSTWVSSLEQRLRNFGAYNRLLLTVNATTLVCLAFPIFLPGLRTVAYVLAARGLGQFLPIAIRLTIRRNYIGLTTWERLFELLKSGSRFHISALLNIGSSRLDQMIASRLLPPELLAILGLIIPFTNATRSFGFAVSTVRLVDVVDERSIDARTRQMWRAHRTALLGGLVAAICATACLLILSVGGNNLGLPIVELTAVGVFAALIYTSAAALSASSDLIIRLQRPLNRIAPGIAGRSAGVAGAIVGAVLLIPAWGLLGAATTSLIASLATLGILIRMSKRPKKSNAVHNRHASESDIGDHID